MSVKVDITRECDNTIRHDEPAKAQERTHGIDGRWYTIDLCDGCNDDILKPVEALVAEHGVRADLVVKGKPLTGRMKASDPRTTATMAQMTGRRKGKRPTKSRTIQCIWCPLDYTSSGYLQHVRNVHEFTNVSDAWGSQCPMCGKKGIEQMGGHAIHSHDGATAPDLFFWARDNNDPYGAYAARLAAGKNVTSALA